MRTPAYFVSDSGAICCPVCGQQGGWDNTNCHLGPVTVRQNGSETIVDRDTDRVRAVKPAGERGAVVTLALWCEAGHRFDIRFSFHKGSVCVETVHRSDADAAEGDDFTNWTPAELWRD